MLVIVIEILEHEHENEREQLKSVRTARDNRLWPVHVPRKAIPTDRSELKARIAQRTKRENAIRSQAAHDG
jgi:hypothetical protein